MTRLFSLIVIHLGVFLLFSFVNAENEKETLKNGNCDSAKTDTLSKSMSQIMTPSVDPISITDTPREVNSDTLIIRSLALPNPIIILNKEKPDSTTARNASPPK